MPTTKAKCPVCDWEIKDAKKVCWSCEVRQECLEYAMKNREVVGVWGGTSEKERRRLRREPKWKELRAR